MSTWDFIVHSIDPFEQRAFTATAGADECRDSLFGDFQIQVVQRLKVTIPSTKIADRNHCRYAWGGSFG